MWAAFHMMRINPLKTVKGGQRDVDTLSPFIQEVKYLKSMHGPELTNDTASVRLSELIPQLLR
jgi:hypothetical protein